jgi:hypothetical protein
MSNDLNYIREKERLFIKVVELMEKWDEVCSIAKTISEQYLIDDTTNNFENGITFNEITKLHNLILNGENQYLSSEVLHFESEYLKFREMEQSILDEQVPALSYLTVSYVPGADVRKHGKVVIKNGTLQENLDFAKFASSDKEAHKKVIFSEKTGETAEELQQREKIKSLYYLQIEGGNISRKLTKKK